MLMRHRSGLALLAGVLLLVAQLAQASMVTITVTIIAPLPCVINGSQPISVDFGDDMATTKVDGSNYTQPVNYTLSCTGHTSNAMKLMIKGNGASFDNALLLTDQQSLGIQLLNNGQKLPINSWLNFSYPNIPVLTAVPVKESGASLTAGAFSASATMLLDYQ